MSVKIWLSLLIYYKITFDHECIHVSTSHTSTEGDLKAHESCHVFPRSPLPIASSVQMLPICLDTTHAFGCPPDAPTPHIFKHPWFSLVACNFYMLGHWLDIPICLGASRHPPFVWMPHAFGHPICSNTSLYVPNASLYISTPPYVQTPLFFFSGM